MRVLLVTLILAVGIVSAFGQGAVRRVDVLTNLLSLDPRSMATAGKISIETMGRDAVGDGGGGVYDWEPSATDSTNTGTVFPVSGATGRWKLRHWDGDARAFGVKAYEADYGATPWMKRLDGPTIGTGDFSVWVRFEVPATNQQSAGLLSINRSLAADKGLDPLNASLEIYRGSGTTWEILFRGTNSSSTPGTTTVEAAKLQAANTLIDGLAGSIADLVVTRSGTNVVVYLNGTNVTASFTLSNPAGLGKSIGSGVSLDVNVGTTIANEWIFPTPINRVALWSSALSSVQATNPAAVGSKVVDHNPGAFTTPADQSTAINAAIAYRHSTGGGEVILPPEHIRVSQINMKPDVRLIGRGRPAYPNNGNRLSRLGATVLVPWYGQVGTVIYFGRDNADEQPFLTKRQLVQTGNGAVSSMFMRSAVENLVIDGSLAWSVRAIWMDRVGAVDIAQIAWWHVPGYAVYGVANNGLSIRDSWGQTWRGVHLRGVSDSWLNSVWIDGAKGPALWNYANAVQIVSSAFEFSNDPRSSPAFELAGTFNPTNDTITLSGHRHITGDVVRVSNQGGSLPGGLAADTDYFVVRVDASSIKLSSKYTDEDTTGGALNGADLVDITSAGSGTNWVTVGPSVGGLIRGDGNIVVANNFRGSWEDGLRLETYGENLIQGNNINLSGYQNPARTNGTIAAINLKSSPKNRIIGNKTDDRENVLATQWGVIADSASTENFLSGNSWDITTPYQFSGTGNWWADGEGAFFPGDGGTPRLYFPSTSTFTNLDPLDKTNTTTVQLARDRRRLHLSTDYSSTNYWYAPLLPSATTQWAWSGVGDGSFSVANNGTGTALWTINGTYTSAQSFEQVNAATANQGWRTSTMRNAGTNSSTYAQVGADFQLREDIVGGWYGTGSGNAHYSLGSLEWSTVGPITASHGQTRLRVYAAPTNSTTRAAQLEVRAPIASPSTALSVLTAASGSLQPVNADPTSGVLYIGTLAMNGTSTGVGVTNVGGVLSGNYSPGSNITFATNANGNVTIASTGGGGGPTNGTSLSVDGTFASQVNVANSSEIDPSLSGTNLTLALIANSIGTNRLTAAAYDGMTWHFLTNALLASNNVTITRDGSTRRIMLAASGGGSITANGTNVTAITNSADIVLEVTGSTVSPVLADDVSTTTLRANELVLTNALTVPVGGTGRSNLTANAYLAGNGTNAVSLVGPTAKALAGWNDSGTAAAVTTGVGVTNLGGVLSGNYSPGSNVTFSTNANGNVTIAASGGGGSTNGTAVSVDGAYAAAVNLADSAEITVTLTGTNVTAAIANDAVDYAQMQNVSAASRVLGRGSASGSGDAQELTVVRGLAIQGTEIALTNNFTVGQYAGGFLPLYAGVSNFLYGQLHYRTGSDIRSPMWETNTAFEAVGQRANNGVWSVVQYATNDFSVIETMLDVDPSAKSSGTNTVTVRNGGFNNLLAVEPNAVFAGDVEFQGNLALGALATATTAASSTSNGVVATTAFVQQKVAGLGAGATTLDGLSDVSTNGAASGLPIVYQPDGTWAPTNDFNSVLIAALTRGNWFWSAYQGSATTPTIIGDTINATGTGGTEAAATGWGSHSVTSAAGNNSGYAGAGFRRSNRRLYFSEETLIKTSADVRHMVCWTADQFANQLTNAAPPYNWFGFRYDTGNGDTSWMLVSSDGTTTTNLSTGIAPKTNSFTRFELYYFPQSRVIGYIDGVLAGTLTNNLVSTNQSMRWMNGARPLITTNQVTVTFRERFGNEVLP